MIDKDSIQDAAWDRITLCAIGIGQGMMFYALKRPWAQGIDATSLTTFYLFAASMPIIAMLTVKRASWTRDVLFSMTIGIVLAGLYQSAIWILDIPRLASGLKLNAAGFSGAFALTFIIIMVVPLPFYQTARGEGRFAFPYQQLFLNVWANKLSLGIACFFLGINWLILWLWGGLFKLIDVDFFQELFKSAWFSATFSGAMFALGIALARERASFVHALLKLILSLFRILAPIVAGAIVLFLFTLPFTGLEVLWNTKIAAPILLSSIVFLVLFQNAAIQTAEATDSFWKPAEWLVMAGNVVMPVLAVLTIWGVILRVDQYGWTPGRLYVVMLAGVALTYALAYAGSVILKRQAWTDGVILMNPGLAVLAVGLSIFMHLPPLQPHAISAKDQLSRLQDGRISAEKFDYSFLKFRLGGAGERAFQDIENDPRLMANPVIIEEVKTANASSSYVRPRHAAQRNFSNAELKDVAAYMDIFNLNKAPLHKAVDFMIKTRNYQLKNCKAAITSNVPRCALIVADINDDGLQDVLFVPRKLQVSTFINQASGLWKQGPQLRAEQPKHARASINTAIKNGDVRLTPHVRQDVIIGGLRFK